MSMTNLNLFKILQNAEKLEVRTIGRQRIERMLNLYYCEVIYEMFHILSCGFEIK